MPYEEIMTNNQARQRDIVLAPNEFVFVESKTDGQVKTYTGPMTITISGQEALMIFDEETKQFIETSHLEDAKQLFCSPPENWYVVLKNPAKDNTHPEPRKAVFSPELEIGKKVNIPGPCSFSLFPGQMAKVIQGHRLRSNQYLLARVYDAEAAEKTKADATVVDTKGENVENNEKYFSGQLLVIKGTEVSFYIPPTGIEVIPIDNDFRNGYVRDAITLERLEYAILKDENGTKEYIHGPKVVFPKPTETFVANSRGNYIFRAVELSKISGIYIKVIAEYIENKVTHPVGEELFITGEDQMIYYPRPEHAIISYDGKILHHAIAIPKGEGRYIMNRLTGEITTKIGPAMYLPDPRTEVVVKRKLTPKECSLWFPGNQEVYAYNMSLNEKAVEKTASKSINMMSLANNYTSYVNNVTIDSFESNASIARGTSYTKPRTVILDNRYDGVVSMDIWTGYAVNVISKNGDRKVVCGPQTILLDYDQTLEVLQISTGKPKSTDDLISTVYLRHENNKVSDIIHVETKDFVGADIKVSYSVDFLNEHKDKWFAVENYVKYMCDRQRSLMRKEAKKYNIEEFYQNYSDITRKVVLDLDRDDSDKEIPQRAGRFFAENGMFVHDVEVLSIKIDRDIQDLLLDNQYETIKESIRLSNTIQMTDITAKLAKEEAEQNELHHQQALKKLEIQRAETLKKIEAQSEIDREKEAVNKAAKEAERDMQGIIDEIQKSELARQESEHLARVKEQEDFAAIEKAKQQAYSETVAKIMTAIQPELVAAMTTKANASLTETIAKSLAPYALASEDESTSDVVNKLLRGLPLENVITGIAEIKNN